jgi:ribonuclease P/MRP protein subunit POP3
VSSEIEHAILTLLLPLLKPLGEHRKSTAQPSRGRRRPRRRSKGAQLDQTTAITPGEPEISKHIVVGLSSTYRSLEAQARNRHEASTERRVPVDVVFVCRDALPEPACNSLPLLVALASPAEEPLRLVPVTEPAAQSIASVMDLPRASMFSICESAPGSRPLLQFVRDNIRPLEALNPAIGPTTGRYLPLKLATNLIPVSKKEKPVE